MQRSAGWTNGSVVSPYAITVATVGSLVPFTWYDVQVVALQNGGTSVGSKVFAVMTPTAAPWEAPSGLVTTPISSTETKLTWVVSASSVCVIGPNNMWVFKHTMTLTPHSAPIHKHLYILHIHLNTYTSISTYTYPYTSISTYTYPYTSISTYTYPYPSISTYTYPYTSISTYTYPYTSISTYTYPYTTISTYTYPYTSISTYTYPYTTISTYTCSYTTISTYTYSNTSISTYTCSYTTISTHRHKYRRTIFQCMSMLSNHPCIPL